MKRCRVESWTSDEYSTRELHDLSRSVPFLAVTSVHYDPMEEKSIIPSGSDIMASDLHQRWQSIPSGHDRESSHANPRSHSAGWSEILETCTHWCFPWLLSMDHWRSIARRLVESTLAYSVDLIEETRWTDWESFRSQVSIRIYWWRLSPRRFFSIIDRL